MSCNNEIEVLVYLAISSSVAFAAPEQTNMSLTSFILSEGSLGNVSNNEDNHSDTSGVLFCNAVRYRNVFLLAMMSPPTCFPKVKGFPKASR